MKNFKQQLNKFNLSHICHKKYDYIGPHFTNCIKMFKLKMRLFLMLVGILFIFSSCKQEHSTPEIPLWTPYDETGLIDANANHESKQMRYKLIQSKVSNRNELLKSISSQLEGFSAKRYEALTPMIYETSINRLQNHVEKGEFTYKELTQWYLYRIALIESNKNMALNAIISINPKVVTQAEALDALGEEDNHPIYGMPILLKDNINTENMKTTAGAVALKDNQTKSGAQIVKNIKSNGGLILGKANLSEWANYLCSGCPNGYSAIGGQTLNPYGPRQFDTGGSSSGSAVGVAANYAVAAVGTETSGSILSPSSQQSSVGLKPTIGVLSQAGIVPISSTLDTPGPISKTIIDNAILFSAMATPDKSDSGEIVPWKIDVLRNLKGLKFGAYKVFLKDTLYSQAIKNLKTLGAEIIEIESESMDFEGFSDLLSGDMKVDLANYLDTHASEDVEVESAEDVIAFNLQDSLLRTPYGQARFEGIKALDLSQEELENIKNRLYKAGVAYFEKPMDAYGLDAILSINNYNAGNAAAAKFPALTVPMGYTKEGQPKGLTFIARPYQESDLYSFAFLYEEYTKLRQAPKQYSN